MNPTVQSLSAISAPPASAFPEWPVGWYHIGESRQFTARPVGLDLFGRRLVCFRTSGGAPVVLDARCWHMGADLSAGTLAGDRLVCPFHGWRYGVSGTCEHIPGQVEIPASARQQKYCAAELAGQVFIHSPASNEYPLPFFVDTDPADLLPAPPFEFIIGCPWWLVGTNGFDLQHFSGPHHRRLMGSPAVETTHPAARRIVATFEVCGRDWRDRLTRQFAGSHVTMDATVWSGTLAFVIARFHDAPAWDGHSPCATSYGMTAISPLASAPQEKSRVRVTVFRHRRNGLGFLDRLDVRIKRSFIRAFLKPDTVLLDGAQYHPERLIAADHQVMQYLSWLSAASRKQILPEETT